MTDVEPGRGWWQGTGQRIAGGWRRQAEALRGPDGHVVGAPNCVPQG